MLPLNGLRVVDFGWVWAGAVPGQLLAFLGAEVIKVEGRKRLDSMRMGLPLVGNQPDPEQQPMFHNLHRGKKSLCVDLSSEGGRSLVRDLIKTSDVVIENYSPGVMERLGFNYEALRAIKENIIVLSLSGGGQTGQLRDFKSYAATIAAYSGIDALCGYAGDEALGVQQPFPDPNASMYGALGIVAALRRRAVVGAGAHIDLAQLEAGLATVGEGLAALAMGLDAVLAPTGNSSGDPDVVFEGVVECQNAGWVAVALWSELDLARLRLLLGLAESAAVSHVLERLEDWCHELDHVTAMERLQAGGLDAGAVTTAEDRFSNIHYRSRQTYKESEHPVIGWEVVYRRPWELLGDVATMDNLPRAPLLGEHNEYVVCELLANSKSIYSDLCEQGILE